MALLGAATLARAEPLDRQQVAAGAKWLVHVDVDAAAATKGAERLRTDVLNRDPAKRTLQKLREAIGMDPTQDLRSITLYGSRFDHHTGVVLVRGKLDQARLLALVKVQLDHQVSSYGSHELHTWAQGKTDKGGHRVTGCLCGPTLVVFGRDAAEVKAALDVLDGKSPSLAGSKSPLAEEVPAGTMLQVRAIDLGGAAIPFMSPVVRQSELLALAVGEHEAVAFVRAKLVVKSAETANELRKVVDGFIAMARLQAASDPDAARILQEVKVDTSDRTVTVQWRAPAGELLKLMEKQWAKPTKPKPAD